MMVRVSVTGLGNRGSIPIHVIPKAQKWHLVPPCLTFSIIRYKSRVNTKIHGLRLYLGVVAIEKESHLVSLDSGWSPNLLSKYKQFTKRSISLKDEILFGSKWTGESSSSYRAGSTDIPDPLSPLLPIVHRPRQVFRTTTCILT